MKRILLALILILILTNTYAAMDPNWVKSRQLTITDTNSTHEIDANVFYTFAMNTATEISGGDMQADCGDIRIYHTSLDQTISILNVNACNDTNSHISFNVLQDIPAGATDTNYWIYYDNAAAANFTNAWGDWNTTLNRYVLWEEHFSDGACTPFSAANGSIDCSEGYIKGNSAGSWNEFYTQAWAGFSNNVRWTFDARATNGQDSDTKTMLRCEDNRCKINLFTLIYDESGTNPDYQISPHLGTIINTSTGPGDSTWQTFDIRIDDGIHTIYQEGAFLGSYVDANLSYMNDPPATRMGGHVYGNYGSGQDHFIVSSYTLGSYTTSLGAEQGASVTANYTANPAAPYVLDPENGINSITINFNDTSTYAAGDDWNSTTWYKDGVIVSYDQNYSFNFTSTGDYNIYMVLHTTNDLNDNYGTTISIVQSPQDLNCVITNQNYDVNDSLILTATSTGGNYHQLMLYSLDDDANRLAYDANTYTFQNIDFRDYFQYRCVAVGDANKYSDLTDLNVTIGKEIRIRGVAGNTVITTVDYNYEGLTNYYNATTGLVNLTTLLTRATKSADYNIFLTDSSLTYQDANTSTTLDENSGDINIALTPFQLRITFSTATTGTMYYTEGIDENGVPYQDFNAGAWPLTTIVFAQSGLPETRIKLEFNNSWQKYVYENRQGTTVIENMLVEPAVGTILTVDVRDQTGQLISDAIVRILKADSNAQRLTNQGITHWGIAQFHIQTNQVYWIHTSKSGYGDYYSIISDVNDTLENFTVKLTPTDSDINGYVAVYTNIPREVGILPYTPRLTVINNKYSTDRVAISYYKNGVIIGNPTYSSQFATSWTGTAVTSADENSEFRILVETTNLGTIADINFHISPLWDNNTFEQLLPTAGFTGVAEEDQAFIFFFIIIAVTATIGYYTEMGIHVYFIATLLLVTMPIMHPYFGGAALAGAIYYLAETVKRYLP